MITLKLVLDTRRKKRDGTHPVLFRLRHEGATRDIKTGVSVGVNYWDSRNNFVRDTHPEYSVISPKLTALKLEYLTKLAVYDMQNSFPDLDSVKELLTAPPVRKATVYSFWQEEVVRLRKAGHNGNAKVYEEALVAISKVKNLHLPFEAVDYSFLRDLEGDLLANGVKLNTFSLHCRTLRAVYNKAIKAQVVSYDQYPFRSFRIRHEKTVPRPISLAEMKAYFALNLSPESYMYNSWLMGQLMFLLIGINITDLLLLTEASYKGDRITYRRAKTKRIYSIRLVPRAEELLHYFMTRKSDTLLGVLHPAELNDKANLVLIIRQKNKVFNAHLRKFGRTIGTRERFTGYTFRYSWANIAKQLGYSKDLIAEALGHEYGNPVTGIYLEQFDKELVDEMNRKVYEAVTT